MRKVLILGKIYTMDPFNPQVQNVYVEDGVIREVDMEGIGDLMADSQVEIINLQERCMLPGFQDSHMHMVAYGFTKEEWIDLSDCKSIREVQQRLKEDIKRHQRKPGTWVLGYGWNHENFQERRLPLASDLDEVSTEHYIFIKRVCIHIAAVNSAVLMLCGMDERYDRENGNIGRDKSGRPNGILYEEAMNNPVLLKNPPYSFEQIRNVIDKTLLEIRKSGITTVQTDDMKAFPDFDSKRAILQAYDTLRRAGRLSIRVREQLQVSSAQELRELLKITNAIQNDDWFSIKTVKVLLDGSLGGRTAAMSHEYRDSQGTKGILNFKEEELEEIAELCYDSNMQLACHAIGDRAIEQCIKMIEKMNCKQKFIFRPRVVHCQFPTPEQIVKMAELHMTADIQTMFVPSDYELVPLRICPSYQRTSYAWKTLRDSGVHISGSSDCPVEDYRPMRGIQAAVTRCNAKQEPAGGWHPYEKLSLLEALELYTVGAAYSIGEENKTGCIRPGMYADFVVLVQDPYLTADKKLGGIQCVDTLVQGGQK